jgi:biopolymer transport protein ExbB
VESRASEEAGTIDRILSRGLWVLETAVTAAPLLGLLGTITGMMQAFRIIGGTGLVAPTQVTVGVAQALIATALGLLIALVSLFACNFYSRTISRAVDTMERLASRLVDRIRLDQDDPRTPQEAPAVVADAKKQRLR